MSLPTPPEGWSLGIDTSQFQGRLDAAALVAHGVAFAYHRATDGLLTVDHEWEASAASSLAAGLPFGGYGVLEPYGPKRAREQAEHFVAALGGTGWTLPPVLDFELARGLTAAQALLAARLWLDRVEDLLGCRCLVYTGPSFIGGLAKLATQDAAADLAAIATRGLWVAHYTGDDEDEAGDGDPVRMPSVPPPWPTWTIWQASGDRKVSPNYATLPGTGTVVDVDWYRGTVADLVALWQGAAQPPMAQVA